MVEISRKNVGSIIKGLNPFKDERRRTFIHSRKSEPSLFSKCDRSLSTLQRYEKYYRGEGTIWAGINIISYNTVMSGYSIESGNPEAKKIIEKFCNDVNLTHYLLKSSIFALVYGDSFMELIYNKKGKPVRLKGIDPKTMHIDYDVYGDVDHYYQIIEGQIQSPLDRDYICHIKFFPRPDSPYGVSLIEPARDTILRKVKTDEAIASALQRHGFPKYCLYVGDGEDQPTDSELSDIEQKFENLSSDNEFILSGNCKLEVVDDKGIQGVEEYFEYFQTQLVTGMMCPEELMGLGSGSTEATANIRQILFERMVKAFQHSLSDMVQREIFNKVLKYYGLEDEIVKIKFKSVTDKDEAMKARWLSDILKSYAGSPYRPFSINEVREMFNKEPLEDKYADRHDIFGAATPYPQEPEGEPEEEDEEQDEDTDNKNKIITKSPPCRQANETKEECVQRKIPELIAEGYDRDQAVAIAHEMCSKKCNSKKK